MITLPKRQVNVRTDLQDSSTHNSAMYDSATHVTEEIWRQQFGLGRVQDLHREMTDCNRQHAAARKIPDSLLAAKPFLD
jgi:hypothetical protein